MSRSRKLDSGDFSPKTGFRGKKKPEKVSDRKQQRRRYLYQRKKTDIYTVYTVYICIYDSWNLEEIPETQLEDSFVVLVEHSKV